MCDASIEIHHWKIQKFVSHVYVEKFCHFFHKRIKSVVVKHKRPGFLEILVQIRYYVTIVSLQDIIQHLLMLAIQLNQILAINRL